MDLRFHGRSFPQQYRRKLHCWGIRGMNPILKGRLLHSFYRIGSDYTKTSVPKALHNRSPTSCTLAGLSRNLSAVLLLYNTCGSKTLVIVFLFPCAVFNLFFSWLLYVSPCLKALTSNFFLLSAVLYCCWLPLCMCSCRFLGKPQESFYRRVLNHPASSSKEKTE